MKSSEIRAWKGSSAEGFSVDTENLEMVLLMADCYHMLREIAAQLSDLNHQLKKPKGE